MMQAPWIRPWRRRPVLGTMLLLSLVVGVGLATAVFTLLDSAFLHPWPVADLDSLVMVHGTRKNAAGEAVGSHRHAFPDLEDLRRRQTTLAGLAAFHWWPMNFEGGGEPVRTHGMFVTPGYFELLGLRPTLGRFFTEEDGEGEANAAVVLRHAFWRRHFGASPRVVGETVRVNGQPRVVVGVAPPGFAGTELPNAVDFWLSAHSFPAVSPLAEYFEERGTAIFSLVGRLRPGVGPGVVSAELASLAAQLESEFPKEAEGLGYRLEPLRDAAFRPADRTRFAGYGRHLAWAAALVLAITCANVAALFFALGLERRAELAVRTSLGATRRRVATLLVGEALVGLGVGGALALPTAHLALVGLWRLRPPELDGELLDLALDTRAFGVALVATLVCGLVSVLPMAWRAARVEPGEVLRQVAGRGLETTHRRRWLDPGRWLAVGQVALALVALGGAGHLLRLDAEARAIDPGFDAERLTVATVAPGELGWDEPRTRGFYRQLSEEVEALPGVAAVALSENRLLRGATWQRQIFLEGRSEPEILAGRIRQRTNVVEPGFFETVGIPLLAGSDFDSALDAEGAPVVIVNRTFAEHAWPGVDAIGQRFRFDYPDTPALRVVGVVEDARYRHLREARQAFVYLPLAQQYRGAMSVHVRVADGDPARLLADLRRILRRLAPGLPVADLRPLSAFLDDDLWLDRVSSQLLLALALLAWLLAAVGLFGVLTRSAERRAPELGLRRALGARPHALALLVARDGLEILGSGLLLGSIPLALAAWRSGLDPWSVWPWAVPVVVLTALACWLPCRRALALDPMAALRGE